MNARSRVVIAFLAGYVGLFAFRLLAGEPAGATEHVEPQAAQAVAPQFLKPVPDINIPPEPMPFPIVPHQPGVRTFWLKGENLINLCVSKNPQDIAYCVGFISAVDDTFSLMSDPNDPLHCANPRLTAEVFRRAYLDYMVLHTDYIDEPAARGVAHALSGTFSCPPKPPVKNKARKV